MVRVRTTVQAEQHKRFVASRTFRSNARLASPLGKKGHLSKVEPIRAPAPLSLTREIGRPGVPAGAATRESHNQALDLA